MNSKAKSLQCAVMLMLCLTAFALPIQSQQRELKEIDKCLKEGNCDCAQRFYNVYKKIAGHGSKDIERRIDQCRGQESAPDGYVDLGLPSGLLWATCNLGASSPEEYGNYYAWSETRPKQTYAWSTYKYCTVDAQGNLQTLTKYNTESGLGRVDNKTTLEAMDDAATQLLGGGARIPTVAEWQELLDNTTSEWTTKNGVYGRMLTSKKNGNGLFLPAAGRRNGSELYNAGSNGYYWSASLYESLPYSAWGMYFGSDNQGVSLNYRIYGRSVRAVRSQN